MRILFVSGTTVGGSGRSQRDLAVRLVARGHVVEFVVDDSSPRRITRWFYEQISDLAARIGPRSGTALLRWLEGRPGRSVRTEVRDGLVHHASPIPENAFPGIVRRFQPDIVVGNSVLRLTWRKAYSLCRNRGIGTVLYVREMEALNHFDGGSAPADVVIANAKSLVEELAAIGVCSTFIPSVTDVSSTKTQSSRQVALMINPIPSHGIDVLWGVAELLPEIPFVLQESWPLTAEDREKLKTKVSAIPNVEFRGAQNPGPSLYCDARVLLVPYRISSRPRVVLEAQANGIPVIARDIPPLREAVGPGGTFVDSDSSDMWANALRLLWSDEEAYRSLSEEARTHSQRAEVNPSVITERFEELLISSQDQRNKKR